MPIPTSGQGAPLSTGGHNILRLADQDAVLLEAGAYVSGVPTAARIYNLPPLANVGNGEIVIVQNLGTFDITVTGSGTDQIDDTGAPGTFVVAPAQTVVLEAKVLDGAVAGSWFASDSVPGGVFLNMQVFEAGATYTPTPGTNRILVQVTGGGGSGGGAASDASATGGGGGAGGGTAQAFITLVAATPTGTVVVGAGGAGVFGNNGNTGVTSSFVYGAINIQGLGGAPGLTSGSAAGSPFIGNDAVGGLGNLNGQTGFTIQGGFAGPCRYYDATVCEGGSGGGSPVGGGVGIRQLNGAGGLDGSGALANSGSGGGGALQNNSGGHTGGAGGSGLVIVWEYR